MTSELTAGETIDISLATIFNELLAADIDPSHFSELAGGASTVLAAFLRSHPTAEHFITYGLTVEGRGIEVTARYTDGISPAMRLEQLAAYRHGAEQTILTQQARIAELEAALLLAQETIAQLESDYKDAILIADNWRDTAERLEPALLSSEETRRTFETTAANLAAGETGWRQEVARLTAENATLHSAIDVADGRHYDALAMGHEIAEQETTIARLEAQLEQARGAIHTWIECNAVYLSIGPYGDADEWDRADAALERGERALFAAVGREYDLAPDTAATPDDYDAADQSREPVMDGVGRRVE